MAELNGNPVTEEQLQALALNNYGHFTSMRVENGRVRGLSLHLDRLSHDAQRLFDTAVDHERVRAYIRQALGDQADPITVRVTVFDPALGLGSPGADAEPHILVTTRAAPALPPTPQRIQLMPYVRELPDVKHVGLFGTLCQRRAAQRNGFDDVAFTNPDGTVSEGATWNIGLISNGELRWPSAPALPGVTMSLLHRVSPIPTGTQSMTAEDFRRADAAFAANASVGVRAIQLIADQAGAPLYSNDKFDPALETLASAYAAVPAEDL